MNSQLLGLLVLAGIALFLILRLRSVLGTRDGFEAPERPAPQPVRQVDIPAETDQVDKDIADYVDPESDAGQAITQIKRADPSFRLNDFLGGAKGAYEMILMGFENGQIEDLRPFLDQEVFDAFNSVIEARAAEGVSVEAEFLGVREISIADAYFDATTNTAELTVKFVGELKSVVKDTEGRIIEGDANQVKRQKDIWTFERVVTSSDPNWRLVATDG